MNIHLKHVNKAEEIAEAAQLAAEIWREYYVSIISVEQIEYMVEKFQSIAAITKQIDLEKYEYYLIQRNSTVTVGYISVQQQAEKLFLSKFYIHKTYRGNGYASQALTILEAMCQERQISHIWLTVNRHNEQSIAVYEKKGFRIIREQVADIGNGYVMDDFVMEKEIT